MKLLHVSDWHLGRVTDSVSRVPDHDVVLAEIAAYAKEHRPDLVVHTGDLFDSARPSVTEMTRAMDALSELAALCPVVVLAGNHDSPPLFGLFQAMLCDVAAVTAEVPRLQFVDKAGSIGNGILHFPARTPGGREHTIRLAPLPFVRDGRLVDTIEDDPRSWTSVYADRICKIEALLGQRLLDGFDSDRDVAIFAAHLHVAGATFAHSERELHVSDTYASTLEAIPPVTYAAFGHIHKPQSLPGATLAGAYAGSPIPLDFGEAGEAKRVVLVEAMPGRPARVHSLPLSGGRPLRAFRGTLQQLAAQAPGWGSALTRVTIDTERCIQDLAQQVRELLPDAVLLDVLENAAETRLPLAEETPSRQAEPSVRELFAAYLAERGTGGAPAADVFARFDTLWAGAEGGEVEGDAGGADHQARLRRLSELVDTANNLADESGAGLLCTPAPPTGDDVASNTATIIGR